MQKKESISASVEKGIAEAIDTLRADPKEDRTFSKMTEILLREALVARGITIPPPPVDDSPLINR